MSRLRRSQLHLAWHNFWYYQIISTYWYLSSGLRQNRVCPFIIKVCPHIIYKKIHGFNVDATICIIATILRLGAAGTLQYQDWCGIRDGGSRKFSTFQRQIAVQRHYFTVSKILIVCLQRWGAVFPRPPGATPTIKLFMRCMCIAPRSAVQRRDEHVSLFLLNEISLLGCC